MARHGRSLGLSDSSDLFCLSVENTYCWWSTLERCTSLPAQGKLACRRLSTAPSRAWLPQAYTRRHHPACVLAHDEVSPSSKPRRQYQTAGPQAVIGFRTAVCCSWPLTAPSAVDTLAAKGAPHPCNLWYQASSRRIRIIRRASAPGMTLRSVKGVALQLEPCQLTLMFSTTVIGRHGASGASPDCKQVE